MLLMGGVVCAQERVVEYEIPLHDPIKPDDPAIPFTVELTTDTNGFPLEYRLQLITGVCLDGSCNLLQATLFWDALGNFSRLEYDENSPLTKGNHKPFTEADYDRLDGILKDKRSILGTHPLDYFLVKPVNRSNVEVDGVTAATPKSVKDAVVDQAAYTSWALWRWVNGEIVDQLLAATIARADGEYLLYGLMSDDRRLVGFALEQLRENGMEDPRHREAWFHILENSGRANCEPALELLTRSSADLEEVHSRLIELIGLNGGSSRLILNYFKDLPDPEPHIWLQLARQLQEIPGYRDFDAAMALLEMNAKGLTEVRNQVAALLESEDLFIKKRAQEFLKHFSMQQVSLETNH
jgi:hypothetical protein